MPVASPAGAWPLQLHKVSCTSRASSGCNSQAGSSHSSVRRYAKPAPDAPSCLTPSKYDQLESVRNISCLGWSRLRQTHQVRQARLETSWRCLHLEASAAHHTHQPAHTSRRDAVHQVVGFSRGADRETGSDVRIPEVLCHLSRPGRIPPPVASLSTVIFTCTTNPIVLVGVRLTLGQATGSLEVEDPSDRSRKCRQRKKLATIRCG